MNAQKLATFCNVLELAYVEQGMSHGVRGAWFQTRRRERKFFTEDQMVTFTDKVEEDSGRHRQVNTFTS